MEVKRDQIERLEKLARRHRIKIPEIEELKKMPEEELDGMHDIIRRIGIHHFRYTSGEPLPRVPKSQTAYGILQRVCSKLLFDTGIVPDGEFVEKMINSLKIAPEKIVESNSYRTLENVEEALKNMGPEYTRCSLTIDENGKILHWNWIGRYVKPEERIVVESGDKGSYISFKF